MPASLRIRPGLLANLREARKIPTVEHQARMIGVNRTTLARLENGDPPSASAIVAICTTFGMGIGECFEIIPDPGGTG